MPPPCRGSEVGHSSSYGDDDEYPYSFNNDDPWPAPLDLDITTPQPQPAPVETTDAPWTTSEPIQIPISEAPSPSPTATPSVVEEPMEEPPLSIPVVATPPPLEDDDLVEEEAPATPVPAPTQQPHIYFHDPVEITDNDETMVPNTITTAISIALHPRYEKGIPKEVDRAIAKFLNLTSAIRLPEEGLQGLMEHYGQADSRNHLSLLQALIPVDDIPNLIGTDQQLWFYTKYSEWFQSKLPYRAFYWELVARPTKPFRVYRVPAFRPPIVTVGVNGTTTTRLSPPLAHWMIHPISYRCYERDQDGNIVPIWDPEKLQEIETQVQGWIEFHVNQTQLLLSKLNKDHALGVVMPGNEYDIDANALITPLFTTNSKDSDSSSSSSSDDDGFDKEEDPAVLLTPRGTYTQSLPSQVSGTFQQQLGWILLSLTVGATIFWTLLSFLFHRQQEAAAVWGNPNVGTEQALEDLLNVGWSLKDQPESGGEGGTGGPRQMLIIYDKTHVGYRDDDSMLAGGLRPPAFDASVVG